MLGKDGRIHIATNLIFMEDKPSFLAKEKVDDFIDKLAFKRTYIEIFGGSSELLVKQSVQENSGREEVEEEDKGVNRRDKRDIESEEQRDVGETRLHDLAANPIPILLSLTTTLPAEEPRRLLQD